MLEYDPSQVVTDLRARLADTAAAERAARADAQGHLEQSVIYERELVELRRQLDEADAMRSAATRRASEVEAQHRLLEAELASSSQAAAQAKNEAQKLTLHSQAAQSKAELAESKVGEMEQRADQVRRLEEDLERAAEARDEALDTHSALRAENQRLQDTAEENARRETKLRDQVAKASEERIAAVEAAARANEERRTAIESAAKVSEEQRMAVESLGKLEADASTGEVQVKELRVALEDATTRAEMLQERLGALEQTAAENAMSAKADRDMLTAQLAKSKDKVCKLS